MIINLKNLNKDIDTNHFKMESIKNVPSRITENAYMESVDLNMLSFQYRNLFTSKIFKICLESVI